MDISLWCRWIPSILGFDRVSRPHFLSEWLLRFIYFNKIQHFDPMERDCLVHSIYWCNSINWTYLYDADGFLQFRVLIRFLDLISVPKDYWDSFILIEFNTLTQWSEIVRFIGFTGVIHLIEHNFMMQMDSFNFGFWFGF